MSTDLMSTKSVVSEKIVASSQKAYSTGYMAAIMRVPINKCPFTKKSSAYERWLKGHEKGTEVVKRHTTNFKQKSWFGMSYDS